MSLGYQGESQSYSDTAAAEMLPGEERVGYSSFAAAFDALASGEVERLVLPVQNSTTGSILPVLDRLVGGGVRIVAEHYLAVRHAILGVPGTELSDVREVRSHPEALTQAATTLARLGCEPMPVHDTAGAVRLVASMKDPTVAALAPAWTAVPHGLEVLMENATDRDHNMTRFVLLELGVPTVASDANKSTVAFETGHTPGALALAITEIGLRGGNLTRIESRPTEEAWKYRFFIDLTHEPGPEGLAKVLDPVPRSMVKLDHLGSYREGQNS